MSLLKVCCIIFVCIMFTACLHKNPAGLWFYTHSIDKGNNDEILLTPASFLSLQKNGTYTRDFGNFDHGKWEMKERNLVLTSADNKTDSIAFLYQDSKELHLQRNAEVTANFEPQPADFKTEQDDPFSLQNNRWRIPATHKESEAEIKKRLINHCRFWIAYFSWANEPQLQIVDVRSTPTPIKIYGNGFGLKPYEELPAAWRAYFFDRDDCLVANNFLIEVLKYNEISWAHTDNRYKLFIGAFQQLKDFLQKLKTAP